MDEGRAEGERQLLLRQAAARFGKPSKAAVAQLQAVSDPRELERLGLAVLSATSWKDSIGTLGRRV